MMETINVVEGPDVAAIYLEDTHLADIPATLWTEFKQAYDNPEKRLYETLEADLATVPT